MNLPSINPQLRKRFGLVLVRDYVFVIRESEFGPNIEKIVDMECYDDDEWNREETMKSMSISNARDWWNKLVHEGFERITTP